MKHDEELIAKALMAYKRELKQELGTASDLNDYTVAEIASVDELAARLGYGYFEFFKKG